MYEQSGVFRRHFLPPLFQSSSSDTAYIIYVLIQRNAVLLPQSLYCIANKSLLWVANEEVPWEGLDEKNPTRRFSFALVHFLSVSLVKHRRRESEAFDPPSNLVAVSGCNTEHDFHFLLIFRCAVSCRRGVGRLTEGPTARSIRSVDFVAMPQESFSGSVKAVANDYFPRAYISSKRSNPNPNKNRNFFWFL